MDNWDFNESFDKMGSAYFKSYDETNCQKDKKNKYKYACGLMTKQTHTHPRK